MAKQKKANRWSWWYMVFNDDMPCVISEVITDENGHGTTYVNY